MRLSAVFFIIENSLESNNLKMRFVLFLYMNQTRILKKSMYKPLKKILYIRQIIHGLWIVSENESCIISRM